MREEEIKDRRMKQSNRLNYKEIEIKKKIKNIIISIYLLTHCDAHI